MIEARQFVEAARAQGFQWYAGVPCSYLTPFINYVLQDRTLRYVSMTNEGDAVALIAGVALGSRSPSAPIRGVTMMQNSGLGNAVSPLTSLTWTFRLPQLLIVTWRGQPGVADEPQHALMGPITLEILDAMEIPWELFPTEEGAIGPALRRATAHMDTTGRPYALVMQKGSVAAFALQASTPSMARHAQAEGEYSGAEAQPDAPARRTHSDGNSTVSNPSTLARHEVLEQVIAHSPPSTTAVFASTGFCGRELYALDDRPNQFYMVGSMGCVVPLALGLSLVRPDLRVVALDGDGAALMRLGAFATVGAYGGANFQHLLLDNGAHESTGGQATVSPGVSFAGIAAACGYAATLETADPARLATFLDAPPGDGPCFARVLIRTGSPADLPRPVLTPVDVKTRFMHHVAALHEVH